MRHILAASLLFAAACATAPPVAVRTECGLVRAGTREQAERVADALALAPQVRDAPDATRARPPEVWVVASDSSTARGICYERRIELTPAGAAGPYHLVHELVHWYVPGSPFDGLPHFVEEGLCDFVALDVLGLVEARQREHDSIGRLTVPAASLDMDVRGFLALPAETQRDLTRLGFTVVSRLGLERVRALASRRAGAWAYLDEAGLEPCS